MMDGDQYQNLTVEEMRAFVRRHEWTFAKTMPRFPHEYLLNWKADNADDFSRFIMTIRRLGYDDYFFKTQIRYAEVDGHKYWTMGECLRVTTVLNRAKLERPEKPLVPNPVAFIPKASQVSPIPEGARSNRPMIPSQEAERIAADVESLLRDSCDRIAVTGDLRQKVPTVRQILFLVIPKPPDRIILVRIQPAQQSWQVGGGNVIFSFLVQFPKRERILFRKQAINYDAPLLIVATHGPAVGDSRKIAAINPQVGDGLALEKNGMGRFTLPMRQHLPMPFLTPRLMRFGGSLQIAKDGAGIKCLQRRVQFTAQQIREHFVGWPGQVVLCPFPEIVAGDGSRDMMPTMIYLIRFHLSQWLMFIQ